MTKTHPAPPTPHVQFATDLEVIGLVGAGGCASVYRARTPRLDRDLALKVLQPVTPRRLERFWRERDVLRELDHPGIVRIFESGILPDGAPYLLLEFVEGQTLVEAFEQRPLDDRVRLVLKTAQAVGVAHAQGIVHRDLKPGNVLVQGDEVRVADFGLAYLMNEDLRITKSGEVVGTPTHMAPEQISGQGVGPETDVWALGMLLYEALTGVLPFPGGCAARLAVAITREEFRLPGAVEPEVPPLLEEVCLRALRRDPRRRPADASVFARELERALAGRSRITWRSIVACVFSRKTGTMTREVIA